MIARTPRQWRVFRARELIAEYKTSRSAQRCAGNTQRRVTLRSIGRIKGSSSPSSNSSTDRVPFAREEGAKSGKKTISIAGMRRVHLTILHPSLSLYSFLACKIMERRISNGILNSRYILLNITRNGAFNFMTWFTLVIRAVIEKCCEQKSFVVLQFHSYTRISDTRTTDFFWHAFLPRNIDGHCAEELLNGRGDTKTFQLEFGSLQKDFKRYREKCPKRKLT